jgi:glutamate N-acetyltransferase/amino-acid N-acetyltransferase
MAGGIRCGIKESSQKKDLALIYSQSFCSAAAMYTKNKVKAASVQVSQKNTANGKLRAIIANSGNANACTGSEGMAAAKRMIQLVADELIIDPSEVAVASTGVIGVHLPVENIEKKISALKESLRSDQQGHDDALEAIMTTDTRSKDIAVEFEINNKPVRIGAMTKGSGMLHPNMATMLTFITTDAAIVPSALENALQRAVEKSFNRLTIDGDTSTNDTIIIMANGEAQNTSLIADNSQKTESCAAGGYEIFSSALEYVCITLARMMARDGEGATKLLTVTVNGAQDEKTAETLAKSIASSNLVKAAVFGADANWGRVLCAMGYAQADFNHEKACVDFKSGAGSITVCVDGQPAKFNEEDAKKILSEEEIEIIVNLRDGCGCAAVWGCDLTYDYVKINGDYRS